MHQHFSNAKKKGEHGDRGISRSRGKEGEKNGKRKEERGESDKTD